MTYRQDDKGGMKNLRTKEAIALAMQSRWQEAVEANRSLIEGFPTDADAYNRLGRAFMELGEYAQARGAYGRAQELDPKNVIALKNLGRLSSMKGGDPPVQGDHPRVVPDLFIEETGRAGVVNLDALAPPEVLGRVGVGSEVSLRVDGQTLVVDDGRGAYLGQVEPRHALRLVKLIEEGNRYTVAIAGLSDQGVKVLIKEVFQDPSQAGRLSFPLKEMEAFRPYIGDSMIKRDLDEDDEEEAPVAVEPEFPADLDEEAAAGKGGSGEGAEKGQEGEDGEEGEEGPVL
ncbi:MAG: tetratricopeptide repeat protein [Dehalococcoidia bacterium]